MHTTTPSDQRHVLGDEDRFELDVHPFAYGGPTDAPAAGPDAAAVVAAVTDDDSAEAVVATASELADRLGLRTILVHSPAGDVYLVGESHRAALDRGHELLDRVASEFPTAERVVQTGDPAAIVNAVAAADAAFIVVGSRGRGALTSALLGSVSAEIARSAPSPVVIVRAPEPDETALPRAA